MIVVMKKNAQEKSIQTVIDVIKKHDFQEHLSRGIERTIIGVLGDGYIEDIGIFEHLPEVERVVRILHDWKVIGREFHTKDTEIISRGVVFGGEKNILVQDISLECREIATNSHAVLLDPFYISYSEWAIELQKENESIHKMQQSLDFWHQQSKPVLVRIRDVRQIAVALRAQADILYLGGELMTNRALAIELGKLNTPIVLCKDKHHTVDEWLLAAERIALGGNQQIILGEAGTLNFNQRLSYRLDIESVAIARGLSHLPILTNVTHLTSGFLSEGVLSKIAIAAGSQIIVTK